VLAFTGPGRDLPLVALFALMLLALGASLIAAERRVARARR
jgi:hypothetical protein